MKRDKQRFCGSLKEGHEGFVEKLFAKLKPRPGFNAHELSEALVGAWNSFVAEQSDYVEKGPMERMLVRAASGGQVISVKPSRKKRIPS